MSNIHNIKIVIVLPNLSGGGVERVRLLLGRCFQERGYKVTYLLFQRRGELVSSVDSNDQVVDLGVSRFRNGFWPLVRYIRSEHPDAILAAMWPMTGLVTAAKMFSFVTCRLVVSEHNALSYTPAYNGISGWIHRIFGRYLYHKTNSVVCVSEGVRRDVIELTGVRPSHTSVIYNPVRQPDAIKDTEAPEVLTWWADSSYKILAIGSLKEQKDYASLLSAFLRLGSTHNAKLLILGDGPQRSELESQISLLGLRDRVLMPGFVPDPYPYLDQADLFVLSSAWEGLGNVIIEALVAGVPVVSTDCPSGPAEILEDGKYGSLVPVGDPQALADAIVQALDAPVDREMLKRRGNEFSVERAADQYLALLDPGGKMLASR